MTVCPSQPGSQHIQQLERYTNNAKLRDSSVGNKEKGAKQRQFEQILPTGKCS